LIIGLAAGGGVMLLIVVVAVAFIVGQQMSGSDDADNAVANNVDVNSPADTDTTAGTETDMSPSSTTMNAPTELAAGPETPAETLSPEMTTPGTSSNALTSNSTTTPRTRKSLAEMQAELNAAAAEAGITLPGPTSPSPTSEPKGSDVDLDLPTLIERVEKSVVRVEVQTVQGGGIGSGFVVARDGTIITNYHVMEGAIKASVHFANGKSAPVSGFYKADHQLDICVIKVDLPEEDLHPLPIASSAPRKGIRVATFGAPKGLEFSNSEGIVSGIRDADAVGHEKGTYIQTTAAISGGNSGGPLVNMRGEVVGANTFKRIDGESLNFAISSMDIRGMLETKGSKVTSVSPKTIPMRITGGGGGGSAGPPGAEDVVGTEQGRILLSQIREAVVVIAPFHIDRTGRMADFVEASAERTFLKRLKWKRVTRRGQLKRNTAIVLVTMHFSLTEGEERNLISDLNVQTVILAPDVDKDGTQKLYKVWDEQKVVGTATIQTIANGVVSRKMQSGVSDYFGKLVTEYRKAIRSVED